MRRWLVGLLAAVAVPVVSGAAAWRLQGEERVEMGVRHERVFPGGPGAPSNIRPSDYVGPEECAGCHDDNYRSWRRHPHSRMNQLASAASVVGDFDDRTIGFDGATIAFEHAPTAEGDGEAYTMTVERPGARRRVYRVTRTIGTRVKQFYAGLLVEGAPMGMNRADDEVVLPFGFLIAQRRWLPVTYFDDYGDDVHEDGRLTFDPTAPGDAVLKSACAFCHNTTAYAYLLGVTRRQHRGFLASDLTVDPQGLREELAKWMPSVDLAAGIQGAFDLDRQLVTVGISCESCHFGGRAHAMEKATYRFGPSSPVLDVHPADPGRSAERRRDNPWLVEAICRQCHSSDGTYYADGTATENSREALELDHGACASRIACTDCHDPHVAGPVEGGGPDRPEQVAACTRCHAQYAGERAAAAHSRHSSKQASCLDCHMPRITQGLTGSVRSHRISVPGDPRMLAAAAPNACNGCHAGRSVAWTIAELARGWGRRVQPDPAWAKAWGGSLETPAMDAWLKSPDQHVRVFAVDLLGRRDDDASMVRLATLLDDAAGTTRLFASLAIGRRLGRSLEAAEIDVTAPHEDRARQIEALIPTLRAAAARRAPD
jgi:hypothetical protein